MLNRLPHPALFAGLALIVVANAFALCASLYNRSGTPDSVLKLSPREWQVQQSWDMSNSNSGMSIRLLWRVPASNGVQPSYAMGNAAWLNREKLAALGFDVSEPTDRKSTRVYSSQKYIKAAYLVMEFDGPAWRQALDEAARLEQEQREKKISPTALEQEQNQSSRLFIVDAGLERDALRAAYPDTTHYSIVRGRIQAGLKYDGRGQYAMTGYIKDVSIQNINVPLEFRPALESSQSGSSRWRNRQNSYKAGDAFETTIAFGKRLEPWILGVEPIR